GLRHAARRRPAELQARLHRDAVSIKSARHEGLWRSRRHRLAARRHQRSHRRHRRQRVRDAGNTGARLARHPEQAMMRARLALIATTVAALTIGTAYAITFVPGSKPDPFAEGKTCDAPEMASWGSYVYEWPSKYDLIFAPQDYPMFIWR